jgi:hypothetical protein
VARQGGVGTPPPVRPDSLPYPPPRGAMAAPGFPGLVNAHVTIRPAPVVRRQRTSGHWLCDFRLSMSGAACQRRLPVRTGVPSKAAGGGL